MHRLIGFFRRKENLPPELQDRVEFLHAAVEDFATAHAPSKFKMAILSWWLC